MRRYLPAVFAFAVVLLSGVAHGLWTDRWASSTDLEAAAAKLRDLNLFTAGWESLPLELNGPVLEKAEIVGYAGRRFVHRTKGIEATVLIVCGRPGPVSVHTPDVCYAGAGYTMGTETKRVIDCGASAHKAEFTTAAFTSQDSTRPDRLQIAWAWNATGAWEAPAGARFTFARHRVLYKMYMIHTVREAETKQGQELYTELFRDLIAQLEVSLFPAPPASLKR